MPKTPKKFASGGLADNEYAGGEPTTQDGLQGATDQTSPPPNDQPSSGLSAFTLQGAFPTISKGIAGYLKGMYQDSGNKAANALQQAKAGNYQPLQDSAMDFAIGTMAPGGAEAEAAKTVSTTPHLDPLDNLPKGSPGPNTDIKQGAKDYMQSKGLPFQQASTYTPVDIDRGKRIAGEYHLMEHAPNDPAVKSAYDALKNETLDQYKFIKDKMGIKVEPIEKDMKNPYPGGSKDVLKDIKENNHLYFYPTDLGFGSDPNATMSDHPMLEPTEETLNGKPLLANDVFRIVHDVFGHAKEGNGFGPIGEENAWQSHVRMYTPEAQKAMTTETRGQNSWVNFGPYGEANRANPSGTVYADQKAGLMPDWTSQEGRVPNRPIPGEGELVHYSASPKELDSIDPDFHGSGAMGKEAERTGRIPRSYYYEAGTKPEDVVVSQAKKVYTVPKPANVFDLSSDMGQKLYERAQQHAGNPVDAINMVEQHLKDAGYDGYKNTNGPLPNAVALFHEQPVSKVADVDAAHWKQLNEQFPQKKAAPAQPEPQPPGVPVNKFGMYSKAEQVINSKMGKSGNAQQIKAMLNSAGVKPEEMEWSGLNDLLASKDKLTKQEIMDHLAGNRLDIKEKELGSIDPDSREYDRARERAENDAREHAWEAAANDGALPNASIEKTENEDGDPVWRVTDENGSHIDDFTSEAGAERAVEKYRDDNSDREYEVVDSYMDHDAIEEEIKEQLGGGTKFEDYSLPGGDNYREKLFTLPKDKASKTYQSSHWDDPNVLAHSRVSDRRDADGHNILHVDEVQSDWHQAGRDDGYRTPPTEEQKKQLAELKEAKQRKLHERQSNTDAVRTATDDLSEHFKRNYEEDHYDLRAILDKYLKGGDEAGKKWASGFLPGREETYAKLTSDQEAIRLKEAVDHLKDIKDTSNSELDELDDKINAIERPSGVPNAPLKKTWHEFVMKRLLKEAAEKNYDGITWTTGRTQADRYNLAKHLDEIQYDPDSKRLIAFTEDGGNPVDEDGIEPDQLANYIGKEAAEKLLSQHRAKTGMENPAHILRGADLQIGGEGMKGFYDKIIPDYLNKLAKKYGGKVDMTTVKARDENVPVHRLLLTPQMKKAIQVEGFPMYAKGGMVQRMAEGGVAGDPTQPGAMAPQQPQEDVVNVMDPDTQEIGSIAMSQLQDAMNQGYTVAHPDQVKAYVNQQKYGTPGQMAATGAEGFAKGLAGPAATMAERIFGVSPEDIQGRAEANPWTHGISEGVGLVAPAAATLGGSLAERAGMAGAAAATGTAAKFTQAGLLDAAGESAAHAMGLGGESTISKIGSAAVSQAVNAGLYQAGDEVSKSIVGDPNQSIGMAAADVGLMGLIGAGFGVGIGAIQPLWKASMAGQTGGILKAIADKLGGIEGAASNPMEAHIQASGMDLEPEVRAAISGDPQLQQMAKTLEQSDTTAAGRSYQESLQNFKKEAGDTLVRALGVAPEDVKPGELSHYDHGNAVGKQLADEFQETALNSAVKDFEEYQDKYADMPLQSSTAEKMVAFQKDQAAKLKELAAAQRELKQAIKSDSPEASIQAAAKMEDLKLEIQKMQRASQAPGTIDRIGDRIGKLAVDQRWTTSPSSDIMQEVNRIMKELPLQKSLGDLKGFITQVGNNMQADPLNGPLRSAGGMIKAILKDEEASALGRAVGSEEGVDAVDKFNGARRQYAEASRLKEALDDRLHVKGSTSAFPKNLRAMAQTDAETLMRRISGKGDTDLLNLLQSRFPKTAELVKRYHVESLLDHAAKGAKAGETIRPQVLRTALERMSPELRAFAIKPEALQKIDAIHKMLAEYNKLPHNFSNTGRTWDKLSQYVPGAAVAMVTSLLGHNPAMGFLMGALTKVLSKDAPDAARLSLLKFLGSNKPIEAEGFKTMFDFVHSVQKGEQNLDKAVKGIFKAGATGATRILAPSDKDRERLDKSLKTLRENENPMMVAGGKLGHYLPDHGQALSQTAMAAVNFINNVRPNTDPSAPLDNRMTPNFIQKSAYNRVLDIAQSPLYALEKVKNGNITPEEVIALNKLYPGLYSRAVQKITEQLADAKAKGTVIPYRTKVGLSIFTGQPLDSSMSWQSIQAAQPAPRQAPQQQQTGALNTPKRGTATLGKLPNQYMTQQQSAEKDRIGRG